MIYYVVLNNPILTLFQNSCRSLNFHLNLSTTLLMFVVPEPITHNNSKPSPPLLHLFGVGRSKIKEKDKRKKSKLKNRASTKFGSCFSFFFLFVGVDHLDQFCFLDYFYEDWWMVGLLVLILVFYENRGSKFHYSISAVAEEPYPISL